MKTAATLQEAQLIQSILRIAQADGTWLVYERGDVLPNDIFGPTASDVPAEVTMRQARSALHLAGKLAQI